MISREELNYVDNYARLAPFPGKEYARSVINQLSDSIELYKKFYQIKNIV